MSDRRAIAQLRAISRNNERGQNLANIAVLPHATTQINSPVENVPQVFEIRQEHRINIAATVDRAEKHSTRTNHRNRLKRMVNWVIQEYPEYAKYMTQQISDDDLINPAKHFHKQQIDFNYKKLNSDIILAFLTTIETDGKTGKVRSHSHIRKFYDALLFGAREQGVAIKDSVTKAIGVYMQGFQKHTVVARRLGLCDEKTCAPMSFPLFQQLCIWAVAEEKDGIFFWTYLIALWNCMGRSASVDPLGIHNLKKGIDCLVLTYDDSKMDGIGEKVSPKNCYANPYNPYICLHTSLGIWFMLYQSQYDTTDSLFLKVGTKIGSAGERFSETLSNIVEKYEEEIRQWEVPEKIAAHSARKGTATYLTSGTLNPPPISSISHRGEWSQGRVQDIYYNYSLNGDHYVGRMLAGLDANDSKFQVLPPHFSVGYNNDDVKVAINICFSRMIGKNQNQPHLPAVLMLLLASVIFHRDWIKSFIVKNSKHPFGNLVIFNYPELVERLAEKITIKPTPNMPHCTGIPTHIKLQEQMGKLLENQELFVDQFRLQALLIKESIKQSIEENDRQSGIVTIPLLQERLDAQYNQIIQYMDRNLQVVAGSKNEEIKYDNYNEDVVLNQVEETPAVEGLQINAVDKSPYYFYKDENKYKFWDVPMGWSFPKNPILRNGWFFWIDGQKGHELIINNQRKRAPVKPFRKLEAAGLPDKEKSVFTSTWKPIFLLMEQCPGLVIPDHSDGISVESQNQSFEMAWQFLKTRAGYLWLGHKDIENWTISTWSRHISYSYIQKFGTREDKKNCLSRSGHCGVKQQCRIKKNATNAMTIEVIQDPLPIPNRKKRKQNRAKRKRRGQLADSDDEEGGDPFCRAFNE